MLPRLILVFLAVDWPIFSRRPMVVALAESAERYGTRVVAVNRPLCPFSTLLRKPHRIAELVKRPGLVEVAKNLHLYSPKYFLHDSFACRYSITESLNVLALRRSLLALQRRLGIDEPAPIVWYYYPQQGYVSRIHERSFRVFELYDNLSDVYGVDNKEDLSEETRWRSTVDLLLATSPALLQRHGVGYRNTRLLKNGLSLAEYRLLAEHKADISDGLQHIPHPRLGFAGVISERLDWRLILDLSRAKPDWSMLFAGRVTHRRFLDLMSSEKNIHYLGEFSPGLVPAIISAFDIGIMPYIDSTFFRFSNPLKFYELCAAGIPLVSSPMDILTQFPPEIVRICSNDTREWVSAIEHVLASDCSETESHGKQVAAAHIWEEITDELVSDLREIMDKLPEGDVVSRNGSHC